MNAIRVTLFTVFLLLLPACEGASPTPDSAGSGTERATGGEPSAEEFLTAYRAAHERGDVEAAMRLVHLEGVSEQVQVGLRRAFRTDFERQLASAALVDLTEEPLEEKTIDGRIHRSNLNIVKELRVGFVRLNTPDGEIGGRSRPVGIANGRYYIVSTVISDR